MYSLQKWAIKSNIYKILTLQLIPLRVITNTPFYVTNHTLYTDIGLQAVAEEAITSASTAALQTIQIYLFLHFIQLKFLVINREENKTS